jgi:hypothetical protein
MSAYSERLDQLEEGNAIGGHASEVEAISRPPASPSSPRMTFRRFSAPWRADPMPGGYVVRYANGQALAYLYSRDNEDEARQAKMLTKDEARRIAINIARLPELLNASAPGPGLLRRSARGTVTLRLLSFDRTAVEAA